MSTYITLKLALELEVKVTGFEDGAYRTWGIGVTTV